MGLCRMSRIKGVDKSETNVVYTLSKDDDFLKQITEVAAQLGLHDELDAFPVELGDDEFYNKIRGAYKDITIVFATNNIFVIASGSKEFIEDFNKAINDHFSF